MNTIRTKKYGHPTDLFHDRDFIGKAGSIKNDYFEPHKTDKDVDCLKEDYLNAHRPDLGLCKELLSNEALFDPEASSSYPATVGTVCAATYFVSTPQFKDFTIKSKMSGREAGFILENPMNHQKWFFKITKNVFMEYFISRFFLYVGIKYPESQLLQDSGGNFWLATLDMSRSYEKNGKTKVKQFETIGSYCSRENILIEETIKNVFQPDFTRYEASYNNFLNRVETYKTNHQDQLDLNFPSNNNELSIEQKKQALSLANELTNEDKDRFLSILTDPKAKKARTSFAKILILKHLVIISDLGQHPHNLGIIETNKKIKKIGLIDFVQAASSTKMVFQDSFGASNCIEEMVKGEDQLKNMFPVLKELTKFLSIEEISEALNELACPKERQANDGGHFLTNGNKTTLEKCLQQAFDDVSHALNSATEAVFFDKNSLLQTIETCRQLYLQRFQTFQKMTVKRIPLFNSIYRFIGKLENLKPQSVEYLTLPNMHEPADVEEIKKLTKSKQDGQSILKNPWLIRFVSTILFSELVAIVYLLLIRLSHER